MRGSPILLCLGAVLLAATGPSAEACGDKFVRVGRGGRFQRGYVAVHPASVLIFVNGASASAGGLRKLPTALKAAGHRATAVESTAAFAEALKTERFDVVLAAAADVPRLVAEIDKSAPRPSILPVLRNATRAEAEEQVKQHGCVVEDVGKKYDVLFDIDTVMEQEAR